MSLFNKTIFTFFMVVALLFFYGAKAQEELNQCNKEGYTAVFINGIFTSKDKALDGAKALQQKVGYNHNTQTLTVRLGYNPSHLGGIGDFAQVITQILQSPISDFDKKTILMKIHSQVKTQKILLVGHSQGALYTNEIYDYLIASGLPRESVGVYHLATPAHEVKSGGGYLTSENDSVIDTVRWSAQKLNAEKPLPANATLPISDSTRGALNEGHSFIDDYLGGAPHRIIGNISEALNKLSSEKPVTSTNGCFDPPSKDLSYKINEASFFVLDPLTDKTIGGVKTAQKYLKTGTKVAKTLFTATKMTVEAGIDSLAEVILYFSRSDNRLKDQGQGGAVILATSQSTEPPVIEISSPPPTPEITPEPTPPTLPTPPVPPPVAVPEPEVAPVVIPDQTSSPAPTTEAQTNSEQGNTQNQDIIIGGGGGTGASSPDKTAPNKPVITSPSSFSSPFSTETITFEGTVENGATVSTDFSDDTNTSTDGTWTLTLTLEQGITTIAFYSEDASGNKGVYGTIVDVEVDSTIDAPTITSPSFSSTFSTSTITFEGTSESGATISQDFSSGTTTVASDGTWSVTLSSFSEGDTSFGFVAEKNSFKSATTTVSLTVDTVSPTISTFKVLECEYSLSSSTCLSGTETINLQYSATDITSDITYKIYRDNKLQKTTTNTQTTIDVPDGLEANILLVVTDDAGNTATSSAVEVNISKLPIVINEIAWAGTESEVTDEWIELYNRTALSLDLSNVALVSSDGVPEITLSGSIGARNNSGSFGYYLIERTDSNTTSVSENLTAAFSGSGGGSGLSNTHEELSLIHYLGGYATSTLDMTPSSSSCGGNWCGGLASTSPFSMERIDPNTLGSDSSNWDTNDGVTISGTDADGNNINGTPGAINSTTTNENPIGYYCEPKEASFFSGGYYAPTDGTVSGGLCTYISYSISGKRHGYVFKGEVGSATTLFGHYLNQVSDKTEQGDDYEGNGLSQGDKVFTAIFEARTGPAFDDLNNFLNYFTGVSASAPHSNYGILEWIYGEEP